MMARWIRAYIGMPYHRKVDALMLQLAATRPYVVGMLHMLWGWAIFNAPDGDVTDVPNEIIAQACGWQGDPTVLVEALLAAGWIDQVGNRYYLHEWDLYAGKDLRQAKAACERRKAAYASFKLKTPTPKNEGTRKWDAPEPPRGPFWVVWAVEQQLQRLVIPTDTQLRVELAAIKRMLDAGYTHEQIRDCWLEAMQSKQPEFAYPRHIQRYIGAWATRGKQDTIEDVIARVLGDERR